MHTMRRPDNRVSVTHDFSEESSAITNALNIAREKFDEHAKTMHEIASALRNGQEVAMFAPGEGGAIAADRLAAQFERQSEEARTLYHLLSEADSLYAVAPDFDPDEV
jgi:hypothetical protein